MTEKRPLTRREMRELERQAQREAAETAAATTAPTTSEREPEPAAEAEVVAPEPESAPSSEPQPPADRPMTRRELRALAVAKAAAAPPPADEPPTERNVERRPVQEPTTSTSIPAWGAVHVTLEDASTEDPDEAARFSEAAALDTAAMSAVAEASPTAGTPDRVSLLGDSVEGAAQAPQAESERPWSERPAVGAVISGAEADGDFDEDAYAYEEVSAGSGSRSSRGGTFLRIAVLVIAFFIIGVLIWLLIDRLSGGGGSGAAAPAMQTLPLAVSLPT
ncbi:MAG TPA: hypothetical protein VFC82_03815 [Actinomycetaceae bacterium]|nr:hypothetical protein [Actinomycetaceae bacterium]